MKSEGNLQQGEDHLPKEELLQGQRKDPTLDTIQNHLLQKECLHQEEPPKGPHQNENHPLEEYHLLEKYHLLEEFHLLEDKQLKENPQQTPGAVHQPTDLECQHWPVWAPRSQSQLDLDQEVGSPGYPWPRKV